MRPFDRERARTCLEHVRYEIGSLVQAFHLPPIEIGAADRSVADALAGTYRNAIVEVRALHARNVVEFLLRYRKKWDEDLNAGDYLPEHEIADPEVRAVLHAIHEKACEQVAHLTINRVTDAEQAAGTGNKAWDPAHFGVLIAEAHAFVQALCQSEYLCNDAGERRKFEELAEALNFTAGQLRSRP